MEVLEELRWTGESGFGDDKDVDEMLVDSFADLHLAMVIPSTGVPLQE